MVRPVLTNEPTRSGQTTLDAQRENNRLTGETNRLLGDLNHRVDKLGGSGLAAFG